MKAKKILEFLDQHKDDDIVIPISKPSMGPRACVGIESVTIGFDWDSGKIFFHPGESLVVKTENEEIWDMARDLIMWIATKKVKNKGYEQRNAISILERLKIDFMKYQDVLHHENE